MSRTVGIDLGTTFSAVAIVDAHGQPQIIPNREGERTTPSVVLFDREAAVVGSVAKRSAVADPLNVVQFVKRQMGERSWRFRSEADETYSAEEISALILRRLKEDAESFLGEPVLAAVITVPAYFNDAQRKATLDAGRLAELDVRRIINEPTAAALSYGLDKSESRETVAVYDLGGGTFDVTIMQLDEGSINVLATGGDKNLGGFDWDNEIMKLLNDACMRDGGPDLLGDPALEQDLRDKAEIAKMTLSAREQTSVYLTTAGRTATIPLTREEFERATAGLMKRTGSIMEMVLEDAGLEWASIGKTLLVGGATRMPAVHRLVESVTGKKPSMEAHPDEAVAMGAALQAALLAEEGSAGAAIRGMDIRDVNSHSMGVIALDDQGREMNSIVLRKDTHVPCKVSDTFRTVQDNQTELRVHVTQGEDADPKYVQILGEAVMPIPAYQKGAAVEVFFEYDHDGIVHVEVIDLTTGERLGEIKLERKANRTESELQVMGSRLRKLDVE